MRRLLTAGLAGLFLVGTAAISGCGDDKKTVVPEKPIELPKEGPTPAGGTKGSVNQPANENQSSDQ